MGSLDDKKDQLVKVINVWLKEQNNSSMNRIAVGKKHPESTQITFNCSDVLILGPQALFYSELFSCLPNFGDKDEKDLQCSNIMGNYDPEDTFADITQGMQSSNDQPQNIQNLK